MRPTERVTTRMPGSRSRSLAVTDAQGEACVDNLLVSSLVGNYTVKETVPAGYHVDGSDTQSGVSVSESTCASGASGVSFHNTPLTNVTVEVDSQVPGGTASTIDCDGDTASTGAGGDGSLAVEDLEPTAPGVTLTCEVVVDP